MVLRAKPIIDAPMNERWWFVPLPPSHKCGEVPGRAASEGSPSPWGSGVAPTTLLGLPPLPRHPRRMLYGHSEVCPASIQSIALHHPRQAYPVFWWVRLRHPSLGASRIWLASLERPQSHGAHRTQVQGCSSAQTAPSTLPPRAFLPEAAA